MLISRFLRREDAIMLDPSALIFLLARGPHYIPDLDVRLLIPPIGRQLLEDPQLLDDFAQIFGAGQPFGYRDPPLDGVIASERLTHLHRNQSLHFADDYAPNDREDPVDAALGESVQALFRQREGHGELQRAASFAREYLRQLLTYSRQTGTAILMKSRRLTTLLRQRITLIDLADGADRIAVRKAHIAARLFGFRGGKALKAFIGIVVSGADLGRFADVAAIGAVFAFIDP